ncbi:MATE family efflux transporter [Hamadaea sp. NPDC051192]|uniref:MATE family efflux transporter n=1 Tax=Hamadaea sp. NPDC051192 TaxID=3154940 RepID=UPI003446A01B
MSGAQQQSGYSDQLASLPPHPPVGTIAATTLAAEPPSAYEVPADSDGPSSRRRRRTLDRLLQQWFGTARVSHRQVASLLLPVVVSQVFVTGFSALGPLMVAKTGAEAISAISTVEYLNIFFVSMFIALATAGSVLVAQNAGAGRGQSVRRAASGTLLATALPAAAVAVVLLLLQGPVLHLLLGPVSDQAVAYGKTYLVAQQETLAR